MDGEPIAAAARRLRLSVRDLRHWAALGLIDIVQETLSPAALERARLVAGAVRRGVDARQLAAAPVQQHDLLEPFLDLIGEPRPLGVDLADAARAADLDVSLAERLWIASGMDPDVELFADDVEALRGVRTALDAGLPAHALVEIARVLDDALGRIADAEVRLFHFYVHEHFAHDTATHVQHASRPMPLLTHSVLIEPAILFAHRKAFERAIQDDLLLHLAEGSAPASGVAELDAAVLFVDLSAYTLMTEAMGDAAVVEVLDRFSDAVRAIAMRHAGRIVKQIGDEFMVVFPDAASMVRFATACGDALATESHFPDLRMGGHAGQVLFREADYLGATVKVAARVAGRAAAGELLVTDDVRRATAELVAWGDAGDHRLKGIADTLRLFRASLTTSDAAQDPVCRMRLGADAADLRVEWSGSTYRFCSEGCRDRFLVAPSQYVTTAAP